MSLKPYDYKTHWLLAPLGSGFFKHMTASTYEYHHSERLDHFESNNRPAASKLPIFELFFTLDASDKLARMSEEMPSTPGNRLPAEVELYVTKEIALAKDESRSSVDEVTQKVELAKEEFQARIDKLRDEGRAHGGKVAVYLGLVVSLIAILTGFGVKELIAQAIDKRLEESGKKELDSAVSSAKAAASQAESFSATASTYIAQIKTRIDQSDAIISRANKSLTTEEMKKFATAVPVGTIVPFAGNATPIGWLYCDGQEVPKTDYPELFAVIGATWGETPTTFRLPGLTGRYLQGGLLAPTDTTIKVGTYLGARLPSHVHEKGTLRVAGGQNPNTGEIVFKGRSSEPVPGLNFRGYPGPGKIDGNSQTANCIDLLGDTGDLKTIPQAVLDAQLKPATAVVLFIIKAK